MHLLDLRAAHPHLFHPNQDWFVGEAFAKRPAGRLWMMPTRIETRALDPDDQLPRAVDLAQLYVHSPKDPLWLDYLWCADTDIHGQRVYVGGVRNGKGFEVHRHLHLTGRWGIPVWA